MSCKIIKERERVYTTEYCMNFYFDPSGGYGFPCDEHGNILFDKMTDCAKENYQWCLDHPEKFYCKPYIEERNWSYTEPAVAKCHCGEEFQLVNDYMGACECPKCGQWYSLSGQELIDPKYWDMEEDY